MMKVFEVFWRFLALGCVSFGGPAAHIGYFQRVFVQKLNWVDAESYARLISLSQFLPGPGSSQIGFALGLRRAGIWGGMAAFAGFTLPSFLLLYSLAVANTDYQAGSFFPGIIKGLKLLAVVVVAVAFVLPSLDDLPAPEVAPEGHEVGPEHVEGGTHCRDDADGINELAPP